MKVTSLMLVVALAAFSCAKKPSEGGAPGEWPKGITIAFTPDVREVQAGGKLRMRVQNNTGKVYTPEWTHDGSCGELQPDPNKPSLAVFVGGKAAQDCITKVGVKLVASDETLSQQFDITVPAAAELVELTLRPDPIPEDWIMINDYDNTLEGKEVKCHREKAKPKTGDTAASAGEAAKAGENAPAPEVFENIKLNLLGATFDPWVFEFAGVTFTDPPEDEKDVLAIKYDLPHNDDIGGFFENLGLGEDCEATSYDMSNIDRITFIARSADSQKHALFVELVQWEKFAEFHQGRFEHVGPYEVTEKWKRYEVPVADICKKGLERTTMKAVSFKIRREPNFPDHGVLLFDNIALIKSADSAAADKL